MADDFVTDAGLHFGNQSVAWSDLRTVAIRTTSAGPFSEDVFFLFTAADGLTYAGPQSLVPEGALAQFDAHLPGFDPAKVVDAMGCSSDRIFRLWHHEHSPARPGRDALVDRFTALVSQAGGDADRARTVAADLLDRWGAKTRRYHDLEHLTDCLRELDAVSDALDSATRLRVELALWYHDAIYEPRARDSEERSARLSLEQAPQLGLSRDVADDVARLVRATAHMGRPADAPLAPDEALVVDIDLSILGQETMRFLEYEYSVREEYARIPGFIFFPKRRRFLRGLLASARIFHTTSFHDRYEQTARANIESILRSGRYGWLSWLF